MKKTKIYLIITSILIFIVLSAVYYHSEPKQIKHKSISTRNMEQKKIKRLAKNIDDDWALQAIGLHTIKNNKNSSSVTIAVIDSGVNLKGKNILNGINLISENNIVKDETNHGTNVAKLIIKINPNIKILPIKVVTNSELNDSSLLAKAIKVAVDNNVDIINISLGMVTQNKELVTETKNAIKNDIPIVSSAGNIGEDLFYPAKEKDVISVISRDINNIDVMFSNKQVIKKSVSAPGVHIKIDDNTYVTGTSFSTAIVSGALTLLKENQPSITQMELTNRLFKSCFDGNKYSYGMISVPKLIYGK